MTIKNDIAVPLKDDGSIDAKKTVSEVRRQCLKIQTNSASPTYFLYVPDIDRNVQITDKSIKHGFFDSTKKNKKPSPRDLVNAKVSLALPEILSNSIEVNRSYRDGNNDISYAHIMVGVIGMENHLGVTEYYAVRSVIEERVNLDPILAEAEILGKLHAVNAKKIGSPDLEITEHNVTRGYDDTYFCYSIPHLLEDVKEIFDDTFSADVYNKLSAERRDTDFSKNLQYQARTNELPEPQKYSYDWFLKKNDMKLTLVDDTIRYSREDIVKRALKNAASVGFTNENGNAMVYVRDIDRNIMVPKRSIVHGLDRRADSQAPVLVQIGDILKNAIRINELIPRSFEIKNAYALVGAAKSKSGNLYIVSFIVNQYSGEIADIDVLYAANAKKESAALLPKITDDSATPTDSAISIAQLLSFVNDKYPDIQGNSIYFFGRKRISKETPKNFV